MSLSPLPGYHSPSSTTRYCLRDLRGTETERDKTRSYFHYANKSPVASKVAHRRIPMDPLSLCISEGSQINSSRRFHATRLVRYYPKCRSFAKADKVERDAARRRALARHAPSSASNNPAGGATTLLGDRKHTNIMILPSIIALTPGEVVVKLAQMPADQRVRVTIGRPSLSAIARRLEATDCHGKWNDRRSPRRPVEVPEKRPLMRVIIDTCILVSFTIRPNSGFETIFDRIAAHGVALASKDTIAEPPR